MIPLIKGRITGERWNRYFETDTTVIPCGHCGKKVQAGMVLLVCPGGQFFCECDLDKGKDDYERAALCQRLKFRNADSCVHQRCYLKPVSKVVDEPLSVDDEDDVDTFE